MSLHHHPYRVFVTADCDHGFLAVISNALQTLSLTPRCFHGRRDISNDQETLSVILLVNAAPRQIDLLQRRLNQLTLVHHVATEQADAWLECEWC